MYDAHVHSEYSSDARIPLTAWVDRLREVGGGTIAVTDHLDFDLRDEVRFPYHRRQAEIDRLNGQHDGCRLIHGIELGLDPTGIDRMDAYLEKHVFDFSILSLHSIDGYDLYEGEVFRRYGPMEILKRYTDALMRGLDRFDRYDVVGHLDYLRRYSPEIAALPIESYRQLFDGILEHLVTKGKGLEINTSSWQYGDPVFYPHPALLERYRELGGRRVTVGSDSHRLTTLGLGFSEAQDLIDRLGLERRMDDDTPHHHPDGEPCHR